jgi:CubicO group peptidase (beta-lactamase class C family)
LYPTNFTAAEKKKKRESLLMNSVLFLVFTLALASASAAAPFGLRDYITLQLDDLFRHAEGGQAPRIRSRAGTSFPSPQRVVGVGSDPHCPVHPEASSQLTAPTPAIQAALDAISALCSKSIAGGPTGCFVSAVYMGESWLEQGFGTINGEAGGPVPDADTVFNIASVSKVFTTLLAAKAIGI